MLRDVFIANGYPKHIVQKTIKESWKIELEKEMKRIAEEVKQIEELNPRPAEEQSNEDYDDVLYVPYISGFSERLQKDLSQLKVGVAYQTGTTLFSMVGKRRKEMIKKMWYIIYHII